MNRNVTFPALRIAGTILVTLSLWYTYKHVGPELFNAVALGVMIGTLPGIFLAVLVMRRRGVCQQ